MRIITYLIIFVAFLCNQLQAQMEVGSNVLYGNEWIDFDQTYLKFKVNKAGLYQINFNDIETILPQGVRGDELKLFNYGQQKFIYVSNTGILESGDYVLFYGEENNGWLDQYLYENPSDQVNPHYSFYNGNNAYFLTSGASSLEYLQEEQDPTPSGNISPATGFSTQLKQNFTDKYYKKSYAYGKLSLFDASEGYGTMESNQTDIALNNVAASSASGEATLILHYISHQTQGPNLDIQINNQSVYSTSHVGIGNFKDTIVFPANLLTTNSQISISGVDAQIDKLALSLLELWYDSELEVSTETPCRVNLNEDQLFNLTTQTEENHILSELTGSNIYFLSNNSNQISFEAKPGDYVLDQAPNIETLQDFEAIIFTDFSETPVEMLMIYNELLAFENNGNNIIEEYANYHRSESPYLKTVAAAEIQQVCDQFAYGIDLHPMGVRNMGHFFEATFEEFQFLLLFGKGRSHRIQRDESSFEQNYGVNFFLPTIGEDYDADNLFAAGNIDLVPKFAIGRIAANETLDIRAYFDKLKEYESVEQTSQSIENKYWTKRVLHLVGGNNDAEETTINNYLQTAGNILHSNMFGADVVTFRKFYNEQIVTESADFIQRNVDEGVGILNVFGHSNPNFTQYGLENPAIFNNKGKYPLVISGGCYSGQCSNPVSALGENMTLISEKGAIGYMAVSGFGYISALGKFMEYFYDALGNEYYGAPVGEAFNNALSQMTSNNSIGHQILLQQLIYQGDPSIRFYHFDKPDYTVGSGITALPENLNAALDSFDVNIPVYNIGKNINQDLSININIEYEDNTSEVLLRDTIAAPAAQSAFMFRLPVLNSDKITGSNRLLVTTDPFNEIEEQSNGGEMNNNYVHSDNIVGYPLLFQSNSAIPVLPFNFHLKKNRDFKLNAFASYVSASNNNFLVELDTTLLFNSPNKLTLNQNAPGGALTWDLPSSVENEQVYYWRTGVDFQDGNDIAWKSSSFIIKPEEQDGWHQSHFQQYEQDTLINLIINESSRTLEYRADPQSYNINNIIRQGGTRPVVKSELGRYYLYVSSAVGAGIAFVVIDPNNLLCVEGLEGNGQELIYAYPWGVGEGHEFKTNTPQEREEVVNFINNVIPAGSYVAILTIQKGINESYLASEWAIDSTVYGTNIFQALEAKGATQIRNLENINSVPYGFVYQEGNPGYQVNETISSSPLDYSYTTTSIEGNFTQGFIKSQHIGPATNWGNLEYSLTGVENTDSTLIKIFGIDQANVYTELASFEEESNSVDLSDIIDPAVYNQVFLQYEVYDEVNATVPQLDYWEITFDGIPELAVAPNILVEHPDSIYTGEAFTLKLVVQNISDFNADSVLVKTSFLNEIGQVAYYYNRYAPIEANQTFDLVQSFEDLNMSGKINLTVEINPNNDQIEQTHLNNFYSSSVQILEDKINPLLSVRFDGKRIINGEIVSPNPLVSIEVKDDNPYLLLNDTSLFEIKIKHPDFSVQTIYFDTPGLVFQAAEDSNNSARIEFEPSFEIDGNYTLFVAARDVSGNGLSNLSESPDGVSAGLDYKLDFEIINKSMISNFYNYPNPFSTSTRFVYTLTGDRVPAYFSIQIMTSSGKIVREISSAEFGPLQLGSHISSFAWDGRDQFGDPLANGVYLYKILAKDENGDNFEKYDLNNSEDIHFINGFGKMVIVR